MMTVVQDRLSRRLLFIASVLAAFAATAQPVNAAEEADLVVEIETLELKPDAKVEIEALVDRTEDTGPVIILQWC